MNRPRGHLDTVVTTTWIDFREPAVSCRGTGPSYAGRGAGQHRPCVANLAIIELSIACTSTRVATKTPAIPQPTRSNVVFP